MAFQCIKVRVFEPTVGIEPSQKQKKFDTFLLYQTNASIMVGMIGFEPMIFCSQSRRDNQATLHPDDGGPERNRTAVLRQNQ